MVSNKLFVVARRRTIRAIIGRRPIARRVGCEDLVGEDDLALSVFQPNEAEFKFGVGQDKTLAGSVSRSLVIDGQGEVF